MGGDRWRVLLEDILRGETFFGGNMLTTKNREAVSYAEVKGKIFLG